MMGVSVRGTDGGVFGRGAQLCGQQAADGALGIGGRNGLGGAGGGEQDEAEDTAAAAVASTSRSWGTRPLAMPMHLL